MVSSSDGLEPTSDGLQPTRDGLQHASKLLYTQLVSTLQKLPKTRFKQLVVDSVWIILIGLNSFCIGPSSS